MFFTSFRLYNFMRFLAPYFQKIEGQYDDATILPAQDRADIAGQMEEIYTHPAFVAVLGQWDFLMRACTTDPYMERVLLHQEQGPMGENYDDYLVRIFCVMTCCLLFKLTVASSVPILLTPLGFFNYLICIAFFKIVS